MEIKEIINIPPDRDGSRREEQLKEFMLLNQLTENGARPDLEHEKEELRQALWPEEKKMFGENFRKWFDEFLKKISDK